jgi:deoxyribonuclease-4
VSAALKAVDLGANCFQIFSASPRMWRATPPSGADAADFRRAVAEHDLRPVVIHDSYLINLASADPVIRAKSIAAFRAELERATMLDADHIVMHPGSHKDQTLEQGIANLAQALKEAANGLTLPARFSLLLENTAGGGSTLGRSFEELKAIRELAQPLVSFPIGYCLDTCHLFAAGFDVSTAAGLDATLNAASGILSLDRIPIVHTNDSKGALGSRLDRHANIGEGQIGADGFRRILNHPLLAGKAFVLETPIDEPGDDLRNVDKLKSLVSKPVTPLRRAPKVR